MKIRNSIECYIVKPSRSNSLEILLLHKPETYRHPSFWQPVTGGINLNETPINACLREVLEETGIILELSNIQDLDFHFEIKLKEEDLLIKKLLFCTTLTSENDTVCISDEHDEYRWVHIDEVHKYLFWESNKNTFQQFCEKYNYLPL